MALEINKIHCMDALTGLRQMDDQSVNCIVTSPPYWNQRDYGVEGQLGLEQSPEEYIYHLTEIFHECKRVLREDGTLWCNIGDSYFGSGRGGNDANIFIENWQPVYPNTKTYSSLKLKPKDLIGIPWMLAFALRDDGWYLRNGIVWYKDNVKPESVKDRCTSSHEFILFMSKSEKYYYDYEAILEPAAYDGRKGTKYKGSVKYKGLYNGGRERWPYKISGQDGSDIPARNKRDVWIVSTKPFKEAHYACYPDTLIEPCILAGCPKDGVVLDPFMGAGTTAIVADRYNRSYIGFEINPEYIKIAERRIAKNQPRLNELS